MYQRLTNFPVQVFVSRCRTVFLLSMFSNAFLSSPILCHQTCHLIEVKYFSEFREYPVKYIEYLKSQLSSTANLAKLIVIHSEYVAYSSMPITSMPAESFLCFATSFGRYLGGNHDELTADVVEQFPGLHKDLPLSARLVSVFRPPNRRNRVIVFSLKADAVCMSNKSPMFKLE